MNPRASLFIGILCISFSPILVKLAGVAGTTAAFYRIFFAWVLLTPYCIFKSKLAIDLKSALIAISGGIVFAADIALWNISILESTASVSTAIANLAPVWVGLLGWVLFKNKAGTRFWIGTAIAIVGLVIIVRLQNLLGLKLTVGVLFALISSFLYAVYILITKNVLKKINTVTFMFYNMLAASVFLFVTDVIRGEPMMGFTAYTWLMLLLTGLFCQLIGWITINYAIRHMQSTRVSLTLLSQTVITGLLALLILHETLLVNEIIGGLIIISGIAVTFIKPKRVDYQQK